MEIRDIIIIIVHEISVMWALFYIMWVELSVKHLLNVETKNYAQWNRKLLFLIVQSFLTVTLPM